MSIHVRHAESTAVITIDRPHKLNALDYTTIDELSAWLDDATADDAIRSIILTGSGDRAFSAGADISCLAQSIEAGTTHALQEIVTRGQGLTKRIEQFPKPIIAAVNGLAYGGGCEIVEQYIPPSLPTMPSSPNRKSHWDSHHRSGDHNDCHAISAANGPSR